MARAILSLFVSLFAACTEAAAQTRRVCNGGLCSETAFLNSAGISMSLGITMPTEDRGEFILNASIPLPYGFVAFTMGNSSSPFQMATFIDVAVVQEPNPPPLNLSDVRSQMSIQSTDDNLNVLQPFTDATTTVSPLSSRTSDRVSLISRVQSKDLRNEPLLTTLHPIVNAVFSMNAPDYLDSADKTAELYLNGTSPVEFVFDGVAARFSNYSEMLKIAGFES